MTPNRHSIDRVKAEQLLRNAPARRLDNRDPLSRLLQAAAAAASTDELASEHDAIAAFHLNARRPVASPPRRTSVVKGALAKALTLKVAAIVAVVSAGGLALAATTGVLPNPLEQFSPGAPPPAHPSASPPGGPGSPGNPSPSTIGLCRAINAYAAPDRAKALEDPEFTVLITTAGGRDKVDAYCTEALARPEPSVEPMPPAGDPTNHPTGAPTPHPSGPPTEHPTGDPTTHPTGPPTTHRAG